MGKWVSIFVVCFYLLSAMNQPVLAQQANQQAVIEQAKAELSTLYQQWRQENPNDPVTPTMFEQYLLTHPNLSGVLGVNFNSFKKSSGLPTYVFNNTVWLMSLSSSASGNFATLYLDSNGYAQPNSNHSGPYTDQFQLEMDSHGKISN